MMRRSNHGNKHQQNTILL